MSDNLPFGYRQPSVDPGPKDERRDIAGGLIKRLNKNFVLIGRTRVHSWYAWMIIGVAVGVVVGIVLIANRSGA